MGNSCGSFADYWRAFESHHGLQGGYIWDWIDKGFEAFTQEGKKYWKYGGDYGDTPSDYDVCLNGILFPDQSLKPAMAEIKQVQSPVRLIPVTGKPYTFILENRYDFSTLENVELVWKLCTEEGVLFEESPPLPDLAPGAMAEVCFPLPRDIDVAAYSGVVYIHADFRLKRDTPTLKAGHVIGSSERVLRETCPGLRIASTGDSKNLSEFASLFRPSLFRVPTENDGLKTALIRRESDHGASLYRNSAFLPWIEMDLLHMRCVDEKRESLIWEGFQAEKYNALLVAGKDATGEYRDKKLGRYTRVITKNTGENPVLMDIAFDLEADLPELPKVGITTRIPAWYSRIDWFGLGPHESYPDRLDGAFLGSYTNTPADLEVPYIVPQENGNRSGVRSVKFSGVDVVSGKTRSYTIRGERPLNVSVSRYDPDDFMKALHTGELVDVSAGKDGGYYIFNIDCAQRGLGNGRCGPDTREAYKVYPGRYTMRLYFA
jgi:beta-galactosidase